jgi:triacylglycerol lipase
MSTPFDNFDPATTRWSPANALAFAETANLAYAADDVLTSTLQQWGFPRVILPTVVDDIRAIIAANDQMLLCAFRGTISAKDGKFDANNWLSDGDAWQLPFEKCFGVPGCGAIHEGFANALLPIWPDVLKACDELRDNGQSLWVNGHSLGGALAYLATAVFTFVQREPIHGLYTFGQPRVGDLAFCTQCDAQFGDVHYRVVNNEDVVTRVPPRIFFHFPQPEYYGHSGRLVYFDAAGVPHTDEHYWNSFLARVTVGFDNMKGALTGEPIEDHFMESGYLAKLSAYVTSGAQPPLSW